MPFLLLLLLLLVTLHNDWPNPFGLTEAESCFFTWAGVLLMSVLSAFVNLLMCRTLRRDPAARGSIMRGFARWQRWYVFGLLGCFFMAYYGFGWGWTMHQAEVALPFPGFKVLVLTPVLVGLAFGWLRQYDVERQNFDILHYPGAAPFLSRWAYLGLQARHNLLFVLPPVFLLIVHESFFLYLPALQDEKHTLPMALIGIGLLAAALIFIPLFLRVFLGLKSLPDDPLRQRLLTTARRLKFRCSDILVWNTRHAVANAMVTGMLPWPRYVVLTDQLLHELTDDEIEAVFGHEVGHMKHHHIFFYMIFILTSLILLGGFWSAGEHVLRNLAWPEWLGDGIDATSAHVGAIWLVLAVVAMYILFVFGWLSRRCERQADIFGCKTASPTAFIGALEKVADLNGMSRDRPGFFSWWLHSTIADRVGFIRRMELDPALEPRFQRRLGWLKWSLAVGLIVLVVVSGMISSSMEWDWNFLRLL